MSGRLSEHDPRESGEPGHEVVVCAREEDRICGARPGASPHNWLRTRVQSAGGTSQIHWPSTPRERFGGLPPALIADLDEALPCILPSGGCPSASARGQKTNLSGSV